MTYYYTICLLLSLENRLAIHFDFAINLSGVIRREETFDWIYIIGIPKSHPLFFPDLNLGILLLKLCLVVSEVLKLFYQSSIYFGGVCTSIYRPFSYPSRSLKDYRSSIDHLIKVVQTDITKSLILSYS